MCQVFDFVQIDWPDGSALSWWWCGNRDFKASNDGGVDDMVGDVVSHVVGNRVGDVGCEWMLL